MGFLPTHTPGVISGLFYCLKMTSPDILREYVLKPEFSEMVDTAMSPGGGMIGLKERNVSK
jgi:hypothetical protein